MLKRSVVVVLLLLAVVTACAAQEKANVQVGNKKRAYSFYMPKASGVPMIVLLNTSGRHGDELVSSWTKLAEKENVALVAFDPADARGWNQKEDSDTLAAVLEDFTSSHSVDRRRIYLFGVGQGGNYGLALIAAGGGQFFAAAGTFGSAMIGNMSTVEKQGPPRIPVAFWVGTQDQSVLPQSAQKTSAAFKKAGYDVTYTELPGEDNSYQLKADRVNAAAWQFFKDKSH